jgi:hypothetical protein
MVGESEGQQIRPEIRLTIRRAALALLAAMFVSTVGCGSGQDPDRLPVFPTVGKVSFKGSVPQGAYVALYSKSNAKAPNGQVVVPNAEVQPDGSFAFSSYAANDGAPAGDYALTVEWHKTVKAANGEPALSPNLVPAQYSKPASSPLKVTIVAGRNDLPPIVLK